MCRLVQQQGVIGTAAAAQVAEGPVSIETVDTIADSAYTYIPALPV